MLRSRSMLEYKLRIVRSVAALLASSAYEVRHERDHSPVYKARFEDTTKMLVLAPLSTGSQIANQPHKAFHGENQEPRTD